LNSEPTQSEKQAGLHVIEIDFGKHADHSAIAVLQRFEDELRLVYLKEFPLDTPYTAVIGTVRTLKEAYHFTAGYLDQTGVGEGPYEEIKQFMPAIKGVTLTAQMKENIMGRLRLALEQHQLVLPRDSERLLIQVSAQQCERSKSGTLKFTHPTGTHDDQLWSLALAVYAGHEPPFPRLTRPHAKWVE
jgi:phage FluMu gp28-like protein